MAVELGAEYLELANTQYYSWAHPQPRPAAADARAAAARRGDRPNAWRAKLGERDEASSSSCRTTTKTRPKKCMNGWGNVFLTIAPDGIALPCHTARMLPGLAFPNVREHGVREIWYDIRRLQPLSRHRLDEGAVRELPEQREGPRRLPLPGLHARAGSGRGRSRLRQVAAARGARRDRRGPAAARDERAPAMPLVFRGRKESLAAERLF